MNKLVITSSIVLISLTNLIVMKFDSLTAPITAFILFMPVIAWFAIVNYCKFPLGKKYKPVFILIGYFISGSLINSLISNDEVRWSSVLYSLIYSLFFLFITQYRNLVTQIDLHRICKIIIFLYLINVSLARIFIPALPWLLQSYTDTKSDTVRFQGFSSEPSYAAFVVLIAFYIYLKFPLDTLKLRIVVLLSVIYLVYSFSSVYGYILLGLIAIEWLISINLFSKTNKITLLLILGFLCFLFFSVVDFNSDSRNIKLLSFIISGKWSLDELNLLDSSAFMRVAPFFSYLNNFDFLTIQTYLGHGAGISSEKFGNYFVEYIGIEAAGYKDTKLSLGFVPAFLYDFGIIGTLLMYFCVFRLVVFKIISLEMFVIFIMLLNANFNTHLFWYVLTMFFLMKNILSRASVINSFNSPGI